MLDVKRLTLLRDLAECGTITAVAELNQVTPSAVSQQLRALEAETGAELLVREARTVRLTAAGAALAEQCEHVVAALERAHSVVRAFDDRVAGDFAIGCFTSALPGVAARLAADLRDRHPLLRPRVVEAEPDESLRLLRQRGLDLAIVYRYEQLGAPMPPGVRFHALFDDPLVLAVPDRLRHDAEEGGIAALRDESWVATPEPSACREIFMHACRSAGFIPAVEHSCRDLRAGLSLVAADLGATVLPSLLCADPPAGVALVPLPGSGRAVGVAVRSGTQRRPLICAALAALLG